MKVQEAFAQAEEYRAEAPTPLTRAIPDPEPMPRDALGPLAGAAEAIEEQVRVPYEIAAQSVLAVAGLAAQAHRNVTTLGGERPISLYCMTIARSKQGSRNELDPPALALSADARRLLVRFANAVEREQAEGGRLEHVTGFASKVAEHAARLAGVLTTYADPEAREISPDLMACGIALGDWYLAEAVRLRDSAAISQETTQVEALRQWLVSSWPEPFVSVRAIVQFGPNSLRETKAVRRLIPMLVANGWLVPVPNGASVDGSKAREAWRVVRG